MKNYKKIINELHKELNKYLHEATTLYPKYKNDPDMLNYKEEYENNTQKVTDIYNNLLKIKKELEKNIHNENKNLTRVDNKYQDIEKNINVLKDITIKSSNSNRGSQQTLLDKNFLYNELLLSNWLLFFNLISFSIFIYNNRKIN